MVGVLAGHGSHGARVQVVSAAHAVVLASGTLSPVEALHQQLFPGATENELWASPTVSCGITV